MKVTLLQNNHPEVKNTIAHVLLNRGMPIENIHDYLQNEITAVNNPEAFGKDLLQRGAKMLVSHIAANDPILVVVDADCDGYTSSALLINYLHDIFPAFVENTLEYFLHDGKQHGLEDCIDLALDYKMVICPDSSSNDLEYHKQLAAAGIDVLILDHHEANIDPKEYKYACIINNQLTDYPNKELSGVGVTWQFCRYLDSLAGNDFANNYLDLVATGNMADMMSALSLETKQLMFAGFRPENLKNPFIAAMAEKNSFSLNKSDYKPSSYNYLQVTPMGVAFFIAPYINAMVRSGTQEEKELVFSSMLEYKANKEILSNKRGHKLGETELLVDQAIRTCTNVKNRQTRAQDAGVEHLEALIEQNHMLDHKVLLFLLEKGEIDRGIAGLCANKFMAKYQRPTCILTKIIDTDKIATYQGSARGYGAEMNFKQICVDAGAIYAEGHPGAFGLCLDATPQNIEHFLSATDEILKDLSAEPSYFVDYIWDANEIDGQAILDIASMNDYWGKDLDRAYVLIKGIKVNQNNFKVMKSNTLKYNLSSLDIIQFAGTDEEIALFNTSTTIEINAVCKCCANEWNYEINPQLQIMCYEVVNKIEPTAAEGWGF
jgi:single-stranded-DNA-specific exonuclease